MGELSARVSATTEWVIPQHRAATHSVRFADTSPIKGEDRPSRTRRGRCGFKLVMALEDGRAGRARSVRKELVVGLVLGARPA
jgi:hypothetical protein